MVTGKKNKTGGKNIFQYFRVSLRNLALTSFCILSKNLYALIVTQVFSEERKTYASGQKIVTQKQGNANIL